MFFLKKTVFFVNWGNAILRILFPIMQVFMALEHLMKVLLQSECLLRQKPKDGKSFNKRLTFFGSYLVCLWKGAQNSITSWKKLEFSLLCGSQPFFNWRGYFSFFGRKCILHILLENNFDVTTFQTQFLRDL